MNKYASGYSMISVISAIGWIAIIISAIFAVMIIAQGGDSAVEVGVAIGVAGSIQGLLLVGMGSIGLAILDGSQSQQRSEALLMGISGALSGDTSSLAQQVVPVVGSGEISNHDSAINLQPTDSKESFKRAPLHRKQGLTLHNISEGAVASKEPFFDNRGRIYNTYYTPDGRVRIAKGSDVFEFDNLEMLKEHFEIKS